MNSDVLSTVWNAAVSSRFDLVLFAVGLMGYIVLFSSRGHTKKIHKKVDVTFEDSECSQDQVTDAKQGEETASAHLTRVVESMKHGDAVTVDLDGFLEKYPEYQFGLSDAQTILGFCNNGPEGRALADALCKRMKSTEEWHVLSTFIRFYMDSRQYDKACNLFELNYSTFFDLELDEHMEWSLILAALQCGRQSLAEHLLQTSQSNAAERIMSIQKWWRRTAVNMCESRVVHMGSVLNRLSNMFNERFPFEEHSDDESTCFLGDDSDCDDSDADSYCDELDQF